MPQQQVAQQRGAQTSRGLQRAGQQQSLRWLNKLGRGSSSAAGFSRVRAIQLVATNMKTMKQINGPIFCIALYLPSSLKERMVDVRNVLRLYI